MSELNRVMEEMMEEPIKLNDAVDSTATNEAATANAVRLAYEKAEQAFQQANDSKAAIVNALVAREVSASPNDTFLTLADKIGQIPTGNRSKTGITSPVTSPSLRFSYLNGGLTNASYLTIPEIGFEPSFIIVYASNLLVLYNKDNSDSVSYIKTDDDTYAGVAYRFKANAESGYANASGARFPVNYLSGGGFTYVAFE